MKIKLIIIFSFVISLFLINTNSKALLIKTGVGRLLVVQGDSLSTCCSTYGILYYPISSPKTNLVIMAIGGNNLNGWKTTTVLADSYATGENKTNIFSLLPGHNDIITNFGFNSNSQAAWLADLANYLDGRRTAGFKIALGTVLPSTAAVTGGLNFNTIRNSVNTVLRTWVPSHADYIFDFGADPIMGPDAAASDLTLYSDGTHPTFDIGQPRLKTVYTPIIDNIP